MSSGYYIARADSFDCSRAIRVGVSDADAFVSRDCFDLLLDGKALWTVVVDWSSKCSGYSRQLVWSDANCVLFGGNEEVFALELNSGKQLRHWVLGAGSYFCDFRELEDRMLILSGTEILSISDTLDLQWQTEGLAQDGVIWSKLCDDGTSFEVDAEMDPPGGWEEVTIDICSGKLLKRQKK